MNQFSRTILNIGNDNFDKISHANVIVFGVGGVGGYVVEALVRMGITNITLVDNDTINITNINRQLIATLDNIGKYKVDEFKKRILSINDKANVIVRKEFYLPSLQDSYDFTKYDYIVDAIDTVSAKLSLIEQANKYNIKIISCMGMGNKLNPLDIRVSDIYKTSVCPLAKTIRHELRKRNINKLKVVYSIENPIEVFKDEEYYKELENSNKKSIPSSNSFVPSVAGLVIASEVVKDLVR